MAVTGVFTADFSNFDNAVQKSTTQLKLLEGGADKVETSFAKMGGEAPKGIKQIAEETEKAEGATKSWFDSVGNVVKGYLSLQALKQVWGFATQIMEDAQALENLSRQTKIGVEDLQHLGAVFNDFGISTEEMGRAVYGLAKRIGSGDDSINDALLQMGLSIEKVRGLKPDELILTISDAAGKMNAEFRESSLSTLFGDKIGQSMEGAAGKIREALEEQKKFNTVLGEEATKALADANRELDQFKRTADTWATLNILAPAAKGVNEFIAVSKEAGFLKTFWAQLMDTMAGGGMQVGERFRTLQAEVGALNPVLLENKQNTNDLIRGYDGLAYSAKNLAGETKRLREEYENRFDPAKTLAGFQHATDVAAARQPVIEALAKSEDAIEQKRIETLTKKLQAGEGWWNWMLQTAKVTRENAEFEQKVATDQLAINETISASVGTIAGAHEEAGDAAAAGTAATVAGYQAVQQQVEVTSDGVRGWLELMRATNAATALLSQNSLYTSGSTLENQSRLGTAFSPIPGFASGIENFEGGLARVHGGEVLANLPKGTSVFPKGSGFGGANVSNVFNLVDTESNLARRVAEMIMRQIRAGTQLGTA